MEPMGIPQRPSPAGQQFHGPRTNTIGALIIRIGVWVYCTITIIKDSQNSISNYLGSSCTSLRTTCTFAWSLEPDSMRSLSIVLCIHPKQYLSLIPPVLPSTHINKMLSVWLLLLVRKPLLPRKYARYLSYKAPRRALNHLIASSPNPKPLQHSIRNP